MIYFKLIKLFFKENFSFKRLLGFDYKKSKVKAILIGLAILYALVVFIGAFGYMFFDLGRMLNDLDQTRILLSFLAIYGLGLSIILVFFRANGALFHYKDYQILSPLPLHPRTVLFAKMTVLLLMLYVSSFIFTLPIAFAYFYWQGLNILSLLFYFIGFIFLPLVPVVAMSLLSLGITLLTQGFRRNKLLQIFLMFAVFIAFFMFSFSLNEVDVNPLTGQMDLFAGISRNYPPFEWYMNAVHNRSIIDLVYLVVSHALMFVAFMLAIFPVVQYTNQKGLKSNIRKHGKPIKYQSKPVLTALVQKEFKKFFSIPLYALNAGLGPVILIVLSVASLFYRAEIESLLSEAIGESLQVELLILIFIGFSVSMTYTPAISLSLEGKNFWIIKSLPIKPNTVMLSKIIFNILLVLPIAVISILLFGVSIQISVLNQALLIVLIVIFGFLISYLDAIINLYMPKFDFVNEVEVIKQSAGAMLGILSAFSLMAINGLLYYLLSDYLGFSWILASMILFNLLVFLPCFYFIKNKSSILFQKLKA